MNTLADLKADLKACGVPRPRLDGRTLRMPKRVFSIDLWKAMERQGWQEDYYKVAYGGFSCDIALKKDNPPRRIIISDFNGKCAVLMKYGFSVE